MKKEIIEKELTKRHIPFNKVKFFKESPYQKRRYKKEFVGWEAWIYNGKSRCGFLVTEETWNDKEYLETYLMAI